MKDLRKQRNLPGTDVADYLNISVTHYYALERGTRGLNPEYLEKLSDFYSVSIDYLLGKTTEAELSPDVINAVENVIKVDPDLFTEMCRAKDLPEEDRKKVREYAAMLIEKRLKESKNDQDKLI